MKRDAESHEVTKRPTHRRTTAKAMWILVAASVLGLSLGLGQLFLNSSVFVVQEVEIVGNHRLIRDEVLELAGLGAPRNVLTCKADDMIADLERNPWIVSATVDVSWQGTVSIEIDERVMAAAAAIDDGYVALDSSGAVIVSVTRVEALAADYLVMGYQDMGRTVRARERSRLAIERARYWELHYEELGQIVELHLDNLRGTLWVFADGLSVQWNEGFDAHRQSLLRQTLEHAGAIRSRIDRIEFSENEDELIILLNDGRSIRGDLAWN